MTSQVKVDQIQANAAASLTINDALIVNETLAVTGAATITGASTLTGKVTTGSSIELGHASDTTLARASAGDITVEGNAIYRAGGTDVPIADGGTGASTAAAARANIIDPLVDAKGDLLAGSAADTLVRVAVGTDGYAVQAQSGATAGIQYLPLAPYAIENGYLDWTVSGNVLTVAIKTWAGTDPSTTDPAYISFRDVTASVGSLTKIKITAANSIVFNNTALIGTINSVAFRLWCVAFNDAGTVRLGLINCLMTATTIPNIYPLAGFGIASSTQEADASDVAHVFYTDGAAVSNKAYTVLGYATWESGLATAGTWSAGPTRKQLFGMGVPLPGQELQQVIDSETGAVTTTSATAVTTNLSLSITLSSVANLTELFAQTTGSANRNSSTSSGSEFAIKRGTATGTTLYIAIQGLDGDGAAGTGYKNTFNVAMRCYDYNQSGATTYTVSMRDNTSAGATVGAQTGSGYGILIAKEIMT